MPSNEGKACDAVLQELERRLGSMRGQLLFPRQPDFPADQQVELIAPIGNATFAVEHTYIEPFEGYRNLEHQVGPFKAWLRARLDAELDPAASFDVGIPIGELSGRRPKELARIKEAIALWVAATAPTLAHDPNDRARACFREANADVPFRLSLRRRDLLHYPPRLEVFSVVPRDTERLRRRRLRAAYWRKAGKLLAVKRARGIMTVLVLEEDDFQGTNEYLVAAALRRVEKGRLRERADEIYLLSTIVKPWYLYLIRVERRWLYDKGEPGTRWRELDPAQLRDVTAEGRAQAVGA